jgi:hypothetical protein
MRTSLALFACAAGLVAGAATGSTGVEARQETRAARSVWDGVVEESFMFLWEDMPRAMPWLTPGTMPPDDVYAVTAYVLFINDVIKESDVMDAATLPRVRMPNVDRFVGVELDWKPGQRRPLGHYPANRPAQ